MFYTGTNNNFELHQQDNDADMYTELTYLERYDEVVSTSLVNVSFVLTCPPKNETGARHCAEPSIRKPDRDRYGADQRYKPESLAVRWSELIR
jgi:hypothetical protein